MRHAWKTGTDFLRASRERRALPWYVSLGHENAGRAFLLETASIPGALPGQNPASGLAWHFAKQAVFLDIDRAALADDESWRLFLSGVDSAHAIRLRGVTVTLDARWLTCSGDAVLRSEAALIRTRLDGLVRKTGRRLPVYLLIDRVDALYGLRSLASRLDPEQLDRPLGAFAGRPDEAPGAFAARAVTLALQDLAARARDGRGARDETDPAAFAAFLRAPAEFTRLGAPLAQFAAEAFTPNPYQHTACLRGIFLGTSSPTGGTLPPLFDDAVPVTPLREEEGPFRPWFMTDFLGEWLPRDTAADTARAAVGPLRVHAGLAALLLGTLALCWHMTWTFVDAKQSLRQAAGRTVRPARVDELEGYLDLIEALDAPNNGLLPALVGGREVGAVAGEMRRRYRESYRELVLMPRFAKARALATAAGQSRNAGEIGGALSTLAEFRRVLSEDPLPDGLEPDRLLAAYRSSSPVEHETEPLVDSLYSMEQRLIATAGGGDVMNWLPEWAGGMASSHATVPASWRGTASGGGTGETAWTLTGYRAAASLFAEYDDSVDQDAVVRYRRKALEHWRGRADALWRDRLSGIDDDELYRHISGIARGEDPVTAMLDLLCLELLPMFPESERTPDIEWLRQYRLLLPAAGSESRGTPDPLAERHMTRLRTAFAAIAARCRAPEACLDLVRSQYRKSARTAVFTFGNKGAVDAAAAETDPFADALEAAEALDARLTELSGGGGWRNLSPLASYHYLRYLAVRQAAVNVDDHWRGAVYNGSLLISGGESRKLVGGGGLLEEFLGEYSGFWRHEAGSVRNSQWDGLSFMFSREFLEFCNQAVRLSRRPSYESICLDLHLKSMAVDPGARERPVLLEIDWHGKPDAEKPEEIAFRNYAVKRRLDWTVGIAGRVVMRIVLPSVTLEKTFAGDRPLADFIAAFAGGEMVLTAGDFPEQAAALGRLGIGRIAIRADFGDRESVDAFLVYYLDRPLAIPYSVITPLARKVAEDGPERPASERAVHESATGGLFGAHPVSYTLPTR